jgi:class 3 adenylate cyclase/tetratricopeptide (TPR) repeat protein
MSASLIATFVFTDLVDSTATAVRLGPEAAEELRQAHFHLLRGAVSASGGTEVKNLGDGLMVVYSSPSRALSGAVGMQQAIERHNRSGEHPLAVRVGISAGEAVEDDGDYFGDPVTEAARLCAAAHGGQILAADVVQALVGRHAAQSFVEVAPLTLKGIPDPVEAVEVLWEPANVAGSVPLPGRLVGAAADALFGFFGRGPELAGMEEARKRAHTAQRLQLVLVSGEAGMGKTALVAQASRLAHAEGSTVLFGHADEDLGVAYQPWVEVFQALVRHGDAALLDGLPSAQRAALGRLMPEVADGAAAKVADPDMERLLLLEAAAGLLATASREAPVLVVLDDLHWADAASLQLLRHIVASTGPIDAVVACTYRGTDLRRGDPLSNLLADLHREANVARIELDGLDDDELVELLEAAAGHVLDDAGVGLAHALCRETDGNPFFTGEIIRHLGETGRILLGDDGRWTVAGDLDALGLPRSIHDVVGRRVERLGEEAVRVLRLAAVIGHEFDVELLAHVAEIDLDQLLDLVDAAVSAAVLVEGTGPGRCRFAHALIQHTLYEELGSARRQRAHHRVAEALEAGAALDDATVLAELARHWIAATRPSDIAKAITYARRAGDAARDTLAPEDAIRWYEQALELVSLGAGGDQRTRAELLAALGAVQRRASDPRGRDTLLQAAALAQQLEHDDVLIEVALGFTPFFLGGHLGGAAKVRPVIRAALDRSGPARTPLRARLLAQLAVSFSTGDESRDRRELALQALEIAREVGDDGTLFDVIELCHQSLATPDRRDEHIQDVERAVMIADRAGDPIHRLRIRSSLMWVHYQRADAQGADATVHEMEMLTDTLGLRGWRFRTAEIVTGRLVVAGRVGEAEAANEQLLALEIAAGVPEAEALATFGGLLFNIRQHQGRLNEIADRFVQAAEDRPELPALRSAVPVLLCELGRPDEAGAKLEAAVDFDYPYDSLWITALTTVFDAAVDLRDAPVVATLLERLAPFVNQVVAPDGMIAFGAVARPLARAATLLGNYDAAERWFAIAHDIHRRLQVPYWTARGQLDHADFCLARRAEGDVERAHNLATDAAATAAEYGCAALSRRAADLLATT